MRGKLLRGSPIGHIKLKRSPANLAGSPSGGLEVKIHTQNQSPPPSKRESGSPPNPTPSPGNQRQPPPKRGPRLPNHSTSKLPRRRSPTHMIDELADQPNSKLRRVPNHPVPTNDRPPPQPITPGVSSLKDRRSDERIPRKRKLLNRNRNPPPPRPREPPHHVRPVELHPVPSIPIDSGELPPKPRKPPHQLRHPGNLERPDVPGVQQLPKHPPLGRGPHPRPDMVKIRPGDGGEGGKEPVKLRIRHSGPGLHRPPVMTNEVHRLTPKTAHHSGKILDQPRNQIPLPPGGSRRRSSPPNVIPNNPKPPPDQPPDNPIPNGSTVRIPVHQQDRSPLRRPILVHSKPNPTRLHPPSTHEATVAATPENPCAKLPTVARRAHVAQGIEHCPPEAGVAGSNPAVGTQENSP